MGAHWGVWARGGLCQATFRGHRGRVAWRERRRDVRDALLEAERRHRAEWLEVRARLLGVRPGRCAIGPRLCVRRAPAVGRKENCQPTPGRSCQSAKALLAAHLVWAFAKALMAARLIWALDWGGSCGPCERLELLILQPWRCCARALVGVGGFSWSVRLRLSSSRAAASSRSLPVGPATHGREPRTFRVGQYKSSLTT